MSSADVTPGENRPSWRRALFLAALAPLAWISVLLAFAAAPLLGDDVDGGGGGPDVWDINHRLTRVTAGVMLLVNLVAIVLLWRRLPARNDRSITEFAITTVLHLVALLAVPGYLLLLLMIAVGG